MASESKTAFLLYSAEDADFALKLAQDLRAKGAEVWIDLSKPGEDFYHAVQGAPISSSVVLPILSPAAQSSEDFNRTLGFVRGLRKSIIPVIAAPCGDPFLSFFMIEVPADLSADYDQGLKSLLKALGVQQLTSQEDQQRAKRIYSEIAEDAAAHAAERAKTHEDLTAAIMRASAKESSSTESQANSDVPGAGTMLGALQAQARREGSILEPIMPIAPPFDGKLTFPGYNVDGTTEQPVAFVSYCRTDSGFVSRLAADLKQAGAKIWMDKLDLRPGQDWDLEIERALERCERVLVVLSPASVESRNVRAEINEALDGGKQIVPVLYQKCKIPFRLKPFQSADFSGEYEPALRQLLETLLER
jgi:hypothetical protein